MGSVWVADHLALGTQVAVKFIATAYARDVEMVGRFRREASAAAQIKSPHVAQVFDHGVTAEGAPYIVLELMEGETLRSRMHRLGPLPLAEVVRIVAQAAKALGRAHQLGIIHRDIKPDNVFLLDLEGESFVKVLDFGIAKQERGGELGMTSTGSMLGTPFFMSPEQLLSSKHVDLRADLWALAVLAYQALTGVLPFTGETLGALSVAVHAGLFAPPSARHPGLPQAVDAWMTRALQRDPAARFGSARELADALAEAAGTPRIPTTSVPELPSSARISRETPSGTALSSSGAQGRTFAAMATTGERAGRRQRGAAVLIAAVVGLATVATGLFVALRRTSDSATGPALESSEGHAAAAPAGGETATAAALTREVGPALGAGTPTPSIAPSGASMGPAGAGSAQPATSAAPSAAAAATSAAAPPKPASSGDRGGGASSVARGAQGPGKPSTPVKSQTAKDTIGF